MKCRKAPAARRKASQPSYCILGRTWKKSLKSLDRRTTVCEWFVSLSAKKSCRVLEVSCIIVVGRSSDRKSIQQCCGSSETGDRLSIVLIKLKACPDGSWWAQHEFLWSAGKMTWEFRHRSKVNCVKPQCVCTATERCFKMEVICDQDRGKKHFSFKFSPVYLFLQNQPATWEHLLWTWGQWKGCVDKDSLSRLWNTYEVQQTL